MTKSWLLWVGGFVLFLAIAYSACGIEVTRHVEEVDASTGSRRSYRQYITGGKSDPKIETSPLETFVLTKTSRQIRHRWSRVSGTGTNLFGQPLVFRDYNGGGALSLVPEVLRRWIPNHTEREVVELYEFLSTADEASIAAKVDAIVKEVEREKDGRSQQNKLERNTRLLMLIE